LKRKNYSSFFVFNNRISSRILDAAEHPDANADTLQRFPGGIKGQPEGRVSKYSPLWACMVTAEDQKNVKEEGNEEWSKNWEMSKHTRENAEGREDSCFSDCI